MTHSLSGAAQRVLAPTALFTVHQIREDPTIVPRIAGVYGWWFRVAPDKVPLAATARRGDWRLLYVGIAPRAPGSNGRTSKRSLRDRLKNHCRGPMGSSTLRRTLACVLADKLNLQIKRRLSGKYFMLASDESALTAWMQSNAKVGWVAASLPWQIEDELIRHGPRLPLNIRSSSDPFAQVLKKMRAAII